MREPNTTTERLGTFTDGVIAVIITIMVLELKAPDQATFSALLPLWPTVVSYAVAICSSPSSGSTIIICCASPAAPRRR